MQAAYSLFFSGALALPIFCGFLLADPAPGVDPNEVQFIKRITEYWKDGHIEDAKEQLKAYLSNYPSSPYVNEVRTLLGDVYLQEGSYEEAFAYFEKIALPPQVDGREALFLRRITEYWKEGHIEDAKKQLKVYLLNYPASPYLNEVLAMLGDLCLQEGSLEDAVGYYEKITSPRCEQLTAMHRIEAYYHLGKFDTLIQWVQEHPSQATEQERMHLLVGDAHYRKVLKEENPASIQLHAKEALSRFAKIKDLDKNWRFVIAYLTARIGENGKAADLYLALAEEFPEKREEFLFQTAFLLNKDQPNKAIALLHEVADKASPLQKEAAFNELCLLYREKQYPEFLEREKALSSFVDEAHAMQFCFYKGSSHFYLEHYEEAAQYFAQIHPISFPFER